MSTEAFARLPAIDAVAVIGLGNIGSSLVGLLPGVAPLRRVILVDPDTYEEKNLWQQCIEVRDLGLRKPVAQARKLSHTAPQLTVETHCRPVENVPQGVFRGSVLMSCVDSRRSRQGINRIACALGVPWIDAAIGGAVVRARVYYPAHGDCMECAWDQADRDALADEQPQPCHGAPSPPPTNAPRERGAIAAALQIDLLKRLLTQSTPSWESQRFFDLAAFAAWQAHYTPNGACRVAHERVEAAWVDVAGTLASLFEAASADLSGSGLAVAGQSFVRRLHCPHCGRHRELGLRLSGRVASTLCDCGATLQAGFGDAVDVLAWEALSALERGRELRRLGFEPEDIVSVAPPGAKAMFFELKALISAARE